MDFRLESPMVPRGDQPRAIEQLKERIDRGDPISTLMGVTGSGKTFTMANVIAEIGRPTLVMSHNKTLAAQLYSEFKNFFPENAVEYFVSYFDYYQPEAYIPRTDTYIEKDASINQQIDRMRHSATRALLEHDDVIIVASVSCIYGIGSLETYSQMVIDLTEGDHIERNRLLRRLVELQYKRNDTNFVRGAFRARGDSIEIFPAHYEDRAWRLSLFGDDIESIVEFDPLTGEKTQQLNDIRVYANSHYVTPRPTMQQAIKGIRTELRDRVEELVSAGKLLEAQRLEQRSTFDLEMMETTGSCAGIENYSRYLSGRDVGEPPPTLLDYLPKDALVILDESHVTVSQIGGMYKGDRSRKTTLVDFGFRLPSALDNRPLRFDEFSERVNQCILVSATPANYELEVSSVIAEQVVRPTGLLDPGIDVRPVDSQVDDLLSEIHKRVALNERVLVTTLTKRMSEQLSDYLHEHQVKVRYLHSDIDTVERVEIIRDLRLGVFDVLVGINLLREGLDIPEVSLVAILDADKEGFLRSERSLIQTMGRASRHVNGSVILYAGRITNSMQKAMDVTSKRREKQKVFNKKYGIIPKGVVKPIVNILDTDLSADEIDEQLDSEFIEVHLSPVQMAKELKRLEKQMYQFAQDLKFEQAADVRNHIKRLKDGQFK